MGYCSTFRITSKNGPVSRVVDLLHEQKKDWGRFIILRSISSPENAEIGESESIKWYEWENDLRELTENHPWMLLVVERIGEEHPDLEKAVFCKGCVEKIKGQVTYLGEHEVVDSQDPDAYPGMHDLSEILDKIENGKMIDRSEMAALRTMLNGTKK